MLSVAEHFLEQQMHPTVVISAYRRALDDMISTLKKIRYWRWGPEMGSVNYGRPGRLICSQMVKEDRAHHQQFIPWYYFVRRRNKEGSKMKGRIREIKVFRKWQRMQSRQIKEARFNSSKYILVICSLLVSMLGTAMGNVQ